MELSNALFISYRRDVGGLWARLLYQQLTSPPDPVDVFYDLESFTHAGKFDTRLLAQIKARPYFLVVLTPGTLERCTDEHDWLRLEIEHAISVGRTLIPLFTPGFETEDIRAHLPPEAANELAGSHGLHIYDEYFNAAIELLKSKFLVPVPIEPSPLDPDDEEYVNRVIEDVARQPVVTVEDVQSVVKHQAPPWPAPEPDDEPPTDNAPDTDDEPPTDHPPDTDDEPPTDNAPDTDDEPPTDDPPDTDDGGGTSQQRRRNRVIAGVAAVLVLAVLIAVVLWPGDDPPPVEASSGLGPGESLSVGDVLTSSDGSNTLTMTDDGHLVAANGDTVWWEQPTTASEPGVAAVMQDDGNFVVYASANSGSGEGARRAVWATGTHGNSGARLLIETRQGRGKLTIYDAQGVPRWEHAQGEGDRRSMLRSGEILERGDRLTSSDGHHTLELTTAGLLVASTDGRQWWRQDPADRPGDYAVMQRDDGNFVVYARGDEHDAPTWASNTHVNPGAYLRVESDGDVGMFTIYDSGSGLLRRWRDDRSTTPGTTPDPEATRSIVPSVAQQIERDAIDELEVAGFNVRVTYRESARVPVGSVIRTEPAGSAEAHIGSTVDVFVSGVVVPDVVGTGADQAETELASSALTAKVVPSSSSSAPGEVLAQDPTSGAVTKRGGIVTLTVSAEEASAPVSTAPVD